MTLPFKHHPVTNWKPVLCCSLLRTGVIWLNLGTKQTTRATAFRTLWKRSYSFGTVADHRVASYSNCNVRWQRNAPKSLLFLLKGIFWSSWSHKQCILFSLVLTKIHLIVSKTILYLFISLPYQVLCIVGQSMICISKSRVKWMVLHMVTRVSTEKWSSSLWFICVSVLFSLNTFLILRLPTISNHK